MYKYLHDIKKLYMYNIPVKDLIDKLESLLKLEPYLLPKNLYAYIKFCYTY